MLKAAGTIELVPNTGGLIVHRAVEVVDAGEAVNPDGICNQVERGIVQALSWSSIERMPHDARRRTTYDWSGYPIHRFDDVPRRIEIELIDRPGTPLLGISEVAQGRRGGAGQRDRRGGRRAAADAVTGGLNYAVDYRRSASA